MTSEPGVSVRVPAKINLGLAAGGPGADGYHDLATVFQAVSLYDEVTATLAEDVSITVDGVQAEEVPLDPSNLAIRAARLLARRSGIDAGVHLHLHKQIPVAGGMAGGSADAAGALLACEALWDLGLTRADLIELAAELGADVPFPLMGGTAIGTGHGDVLTPALARGEFQWVLAFAPFGLSTPRVFGELDRLRAGRVLPEPRVADQLMHALRSGDAQALGEALHNDLQPAALSLAPKLERTLAVGRDCGVLGALVSGSGPTVAFLVSGADMALDLSIGLTASGAVRDVRRVHGPVPGARIIDPARGGR
ncbi:MAG: 4-(cytidine 5'-diphospho)-2-C-methyl-D-erythritol kinase [Kineosporiaceae bacterium]